MAKVCLCTSSSKIQALQLLLCCLCCGATTHNAIHLEAKQPTHLTPSPQCGVIASTSHSPCLFGNLAQLNRTQLESARFYWRFARRTLHCVYVIFVVGMLVLPSVMYVGLIQSYNINSRSAIYMHVYVQALYCRLLYCHIVYIYLYVYCVYLNWKNIICSIFLTRLN